MEVSAIPCGMTSPVPALHTRRGKPARKFSGVNSAHVPPVHSASWFLKGLNVSCIHSCRPSNLLGTFQLSKPETVKKKKRNSGLDNLEKRVWEVYKARSDQYHDQDDLCDSCWLEFLSEKNGPLQQQTQLFDYFNLICEELSKWYLPLLSRYREYAANGCSCHTVVPWLCTWPSKPKASSHLNRENKAYPACFLVYALCVQCMH